MSLSYVLPSVRFMPPVPLEQCRRHAVIWLSARPWSCTKRLLARHLINQIFQLRCSLAQK